MNTINLSDAKEVKRIVLTAFPNYRKRRAFLSEFHPIRINSYWDGGSRDEFALVHLETLQCAPLPTNTHPFFDLARYGVVDQSNRALAVDHVGNATLLLLPPNFALVQAGIFCGKSATAHVYVNAENLTPLLGGLIGGDDS